MWIRLSKLTPLLDVPIRILTLSDYSHVDYVIPDKYRDQHRGHRFIGALPFVGTCAHSKPLSREKYLFLDISTNNEWYIHNYLTYQINSGYDWGAVCFKPHRDHYLRDGTKWFSAELIYAALLNRDIRIATRFEDRVVVNDFLQSPDFVEGIYVAEKH